MYAYKYESARGVIIDIQTHQISQSTKPQDGFPLQPAFQLPQNSLFPPFSQEAGGRIGFLYHRLHISDIRRNNEVTRKLYIESPPPPFFTRVLVLFHEQRTTNSNPRSLFSSSGCIHHLLLVVCISSTVFIKEPEPLFSYKSNRFSWHWLMMLDLLEFSHPGGSGG